MENQLNDDKQFKLMLMKEMFPNGIELIVESDPIPCTRENRSRWWIVNWWRKRKGTYYEYGYEYKVKLRKEYGTK